MVKKVETIVCPECGSPLGVNKNACICGWKREAQQPQQATIDMDAVRAAYAFRVGLLLEKPEIVYERKGDGVDWARKIMARRAAGEILPIISEDFAKQALAMVYTPPEPLREPGEDFEEMT